MVVNVLVRVEVGLVPVVELSVLDELIVIVVVTVVSVVVMDVVEFNHGVVVLLQGSWRNKKEQICFIHT